MEIHFHKNFRKSLDKLPLNQKKRVSDVLDLFELNPHAEHLRNHALKGKLLGYRYISAGGDLRLIFREIDGYRIVEFILIGTHNQVY